MTTMNKELAKMIDHTALKPDTSREQIEKLCDEARDFNFASVCVNPTWVALAAEKLEGAEAKVCTVIGFPLGAVTTETKAFETKDAIQKGATEVDMVINIGALKDGNNELVEQDIKAVVEAAKGKALVKVIIETCLLTDEEKKRACELSVKAGADYVKTSTGFSTSGATVEDIKLMRNTVGPNIGVKASGGVRDLEGSQAMIDAGATRIGASAGVKIVQGETADTDY
jgi:deoxyribose-phosphate aldolase